MSLIKLASTKQKDTMKKRFKRHPVLYPASLASMIGGYGLFIHNGKKMPKIRDLRKPPNLIKHLIVPISIIGAGDVGLQYIKYKHSVEEK